MWWTCVWTSTYTTSLSFWTQTLNLLFGVDQCLDLELHCIRVRIRTLAHNLDLDEHLDLDLVQDHLSTYSWTSI